MEIRDKIYNWTKAKDKKYQTRTPTENELHALRIYSLNYTKFSYSCIGFAIAIIIVAFTLI